jgi:hypothetical protein
MFSTGDTIQQRPPEVKFYLQKNRKNRPAFSLTLRRGYFRPAEKRSYSNVVRLLPLPCKRFACDSTV